MKILSLQLQLWQVIPRRIKLVKQGIEEGVCSHRNNTKQCCTTAATLLLLVAKKKQRVHDMPSSHEGKGVQQN